MLHYVPLATGSEGNVHLLVAQADPAPDGTPAPRTVVLIDAGLPVDELARRLSVCGVRVDEVAAVFLTHEHGDHVGHLGATMQATGAPLFGTAGTLGAVEAQLQKASAKKKVAPPTPDWLADAHVVRAHWPVRLGGLVLEAATTVHGGMVGRTSVLASCAEPVSYGVTEDATGARLAVVTDTGRPTQSLRRIAKHCDALFVESNYDLATLMALPSEVYPDALKGRISSPFGHLSNRMAGLFAADHLSPRLQSVVLGHLSQHSNTPALALASALTHLGAVGYRGAVGISYQDAVGPCTSISGPGLVVVKPLRATVDRTLAGDPPTVDARILPASAAPAVEEAPAVDDAPALAAGGELPHTPTHTADPVVRRPRAVVRAV